MYTDEAFHTEYIRYSEYRNELFHTKWHFRGVTEKFHSVMEKFHSVTEKCPALLASVMEKIHGVTENFFRYTRNFSVTLGLESHYIECVEKPTWCDRKSLGNAIVCGKIHFHLKACLYKKLHTVDQRSVWTNLYKYKLMKIFYFLEIL